MGPMDGLDGCGKSLPPASDSQTVRPVASRYTDYAIPTHTRKQRALKNPRTSKCNYSLHFYIFTDIISAVRVFFYN